MFQDSDQNNNSILNYLPLKYRIYAYLILGGLVFFIILIVVLFSDGAGGSFLFDETKKDTNGICTLRKPIEDGKYTSIGSLYGYRILDSNISVSQFHQGIDIRAAEGTDVSAAHAGEVVVARKTDTGDYGKHIKIKADNGDITLYGHLSSVAVNVGDKVSSGQKIGEVGSTGTSTGNHLHFQYTPSGGTNTNKPTESVNRLYGFTDVDECIKYTGSKNKTFLNWCNNDNNRLSSYSNWSSIKKEAPKTRKMTMEEKTAFAISCNSLSGVEIASGGSCNTMLKTNNSKVSVSSNLTSQMAGISNGSYKGLPIRLISCGCDSGNAEAEDYPGGASNVSGNLVANDAITLKDYIMNVAYAEMGGSATTEKIEAIKLQMILAKTYLLSHGEKAKEVNGEIWAPIDGCCFQVYRAKNIKDTAKQLLSSAYDEVEGVLLYRKNGDLTGGGYAQNLQNIMSDYAAAGYKYYEIINQSRFLEWRNGYYSETSEYGAVELKNCSYNDKDTIE